MADVNLVGTVLLAGINTDDPDGPPVLLKLNADGTLAGGGGGAPTSAAAVVSYLGNNTIETSEETITNNRIYWKIITLSVDGIVLTIEAYVTQETTDSTVQGTAGLCTNVASVPSVVRGISSGASATNGGFLMAVATGAGWLAFPLGLWLPAGSYFVGVQFAVTAADFRIHFNTIGADLISTTGGPYFAPHDVHNTSDSTNSYSIRAAFLPTALVSP